MKQLSKLQRAQKALLVTKLNETHAALSEASTDFYDKIQDLWEELVVPRLEDYNQAIADAEGLKSEVTDAMDEWLGERSDKWNESDAASEYNDWKSEWDELSFDDADLEKPEFEGFSDDDPSDAFGNVRDGVHE